MSEPLLTHTFLGDQEKEKDKINEFLTKDCSIEDEDESDYEEAETTIKLRRAGKIQKKKRIFQPTVMPSKDSPSDKSSNQTFIQCNNSNIFNESHHSNDSKHSDDSNQ